MSRLDSRLNKWLFVMGHLAELSDHPTPLKEESIFNQLFDIAEIANFSPAEKETYESSLKYYRDLNNVVDTPRKEDRQEGRQKGIEQVAKQMKAGGVSSQQIATYTGLSSEEIDSL